MRSSCVSILPPFANVERYPEHQTTIDDIVAVAEFVFHLIFCAALVRELAETGIMGKNVD